MGDLRAVGALALLAILVVACGPQPVAPVADADAPARRLVALSPSLTELVYAAGAGDRLVGVVEFSDKPDAARSLPRVGDAFRLDYEVIASLKPDLILGWPSGNGPATLERLRRLGYRVEALEPVALNDISGQIRRIGLLAGTAAAADAAAADFDRQLAALKTAHADASRLRVFYQVATEPLITVTDRHFIGQVLDVCGADNVFGDLPGGAVTVGMESVLAAAPEVIVANEFTVGTPGIEGRSPLDGWRRWTQVPAVARGLLFVADPDLMSVPGPRLLQGADQVCRDLDSARRQLNATPGASPESAL